jgi:hypothetical protein
MVVSMESSKRAVTTEITGTTTIVRKHQIDHARKLVIFFVRDVGVVVRDSILIAQV